MVTVVNKYKVDIQPEDLYIGRGSVLGNPYTHLDSVKCNKAKYFVKTREEAVQKYKNYILKRVLVNDVDVINEFYKIIHTDRDLRLVCFCKPKSCHGDIIVELCQDEVFKQAIDIKFKELN